MLFRPKTTSERHAWLGTGWASATFVAIALAPAAHAQFQVELKTDHQNFVRFAPVIATVTVRNYGARPVIIGGTNQTARLFFDITRLPGTPVPALTKRLLRSETVLLPQHEAALQVNLAPHYAIHTAASYTVRAVIETGGELYFSGPTNIRTQHGLTIAKTTTTRHGYRKLARVYTLRYIPRRRNEVLFLCSENEEATESYGVATLGTIVRIRRPTLLVDQYGNAHVLHQSSPEYFTHSVVGPNGRRRHSQLYRAAASGIVLQKAPDGGVDVSGGFPVGRSDDQNLPAPPMPR